MSQLASLFQFLCSNLMLQMKVMMLTKIEIDEVLGLVRYI